MAAVMIIKFTVVILFSLYRVFYLSIPHHPIYLHMHYPLIFQTHTRVVIPYTHMTDY